MNLTINGRTYGVCSGYRKASVTIGDEYPAVECLVFEMASRSDGLTLPMYVPVSDLYTFNKGRDIEITTRSFLGPR